MSNIAGPNAELAADIEAWWATDISHISPGVIEICGYPIADLITSQSLPSVIWLLLRGTLPQPAESRLLQAALVASVDHGPLAPSIAAARMAITCGVGINNALATGVNMLGDVHGGAGQQCMELLLEMRAKEGNDTSRRAAVQGVLDEWRVRDRYLPGFGHRIHRTDPRRAPLLTMLEAATSEGTIEGHFLALGYEIEDCLRAEGRQLPINIDGCTAIVYSELGFPPPLGRGLFALGRSVGILAHAWEESRQGRRIKGPVPPRRLT